MFVFCRLCTFWKSLGHISVPLLSLLYFYSMRKPLWNSCLLCPKRESYSSSLWCYCHYDQLTTVMSLIIKKCSSLQCLPVHSTISCRLEFAPSTQKTSGACAHNCTRTWTAASSVNRLEYRLPSWHLLDTFQTIPGLRQSRPFFSPATDLLNKKQYQWNKTYLPRTESIDKGTFNCGDCFGYCWYYLIIFLQLYEENFFCFWAISKSLFRRFQFGKLK